MRLDSLATRARTSLAALAAALAVVAGPGAASAAARPVAAPVKPARVPNVLVDPDNSIIGAHNTPDLAQNPTRGTNLVVTDRVDLPDYSATVHVSADGGRTWGASPLPVPGGQGEKLYAAQAAFDARGTLFVLFVTLSGPGNGPDSLWIVRSGDGGLTFSAPSKVTGPDAFQAALALDRHTGRLFAAWLQSDAEASACLLCFGKTNLPIVVSHSDDEGATWSAPVAVSEGRERVGAPVLRVDDDGNPVVLYVDFGDDQVDWQNLEGVANSDWSLVLTRSPDQGATFGPGQVVDDGVVAPYRFLIYLPPKPSMVVSGTSVVVAWTDGRSGSPAVLVRRSANRGATWTAPVRVGAAGTRSDLPALSASSGGRVDVLYYQGAESGTDAQVMLASSGDGGRHFGRTVQVSTAASNRKVGPKFSLLQQDADFGSGIVLRPDGRNVLAAWTDTRNGTLDTARQDVFFAVVARAGAGHGLLIAVSALGGALGVAGIALFLLARSRSRATPTEPPPA
ncbi:MAG: sialidase family protein, partial [Acidimicrobiales bacterium]